MKLASTKNLFKKRSAPVVGLFFAFLAGCATYQSKVYDARLYLQQGEYDKAIDKLKPLAEKDDGDQLIYLLDYATAEQMAGRYKESSDLFLKAEHLSEMNDYHSISRVAGAAILSEEMVQYKGDTFEKTFINAYLAINYLQMGMLDDALVEARRINEKYLKLRGEEKKSYEINPFAKYLSALVWEADQKWDDAYIAYSETYKIDPSIPALKEDLLRSAKRAQRESEYKKWKEKFPEVPENPLWGSKKTGELIVIHMQGWGPRKQPSAESYRFPTLVPVYSETTGLKLTVEGDKDPATNARMVYDVSDASIQTLKDDYAALVARRIGGIVAKDVLADEISKKDKALGALAWVVMHASDRADLRQWSTLPATIQIIRKPLAAGKYDINLQGLNSSGGISSEASSKQQVEIKAGQKKFVLFRSVK